MDKILGYDTCIAWENIFFKVLRPRDQQWLLHCESLVNRSFEKLDDLRRLVSKYHRKGFQDHLCDTNVVKVIQDVNHELKTLWTLLLDTVVKSRVSLSIRLQKHQRNPVSERGECPLGLHQQKFVMNELNHFSIASVIVPETLSLEYDSPELQLHAFFENGNILSLDMEVVPEKHVHPRLGGV